MDEEKRIDDENNFDPMQIVASIIDGHQERMDEKYFNENGFCCPFEFYNK